MSNLLKSKFLLGVMTVAIMFVGVVAVSAKTASADCSITSTLRLGSTGAQVQCLQTSLGGLTADGSFGPMTKAAVVHWQSISGLTADGVFGPLSNAVWVANAGNSANFPSGCTSAVGFSTTNGASCAGSGLNLPAGCSTTAGFSPTTGMACSVASNLPAGCSTTAGFSPTTGASCSSTTTTTTTTTGPLAGTSGEIADINQLSQYSSEQVGSGSTDIKVLGFDVQASKDGDVGINTIKLTFDSGGNGATESDRITDYLTKVYVWEGSTKVGSASTADFNKDSTGVYSKTLALTNAVVRADKTEKFYVSVDAVSNLDSGDIAADSWTIAINNLRYVDGSGITTTVDSADALLTGNMDYDAAADGVPISFVTFSTAADTELKISVDTSNPATQVVKVNATADTNNVVLLKGKMKLTGTSNVWLDELPITLTSTGTGDTTGSISAITGSVTLTIDGKEFTESTGANCVLEGSLWIGVDNCDATQTAGILFDNLNLDITAGSTINFTVSADINDINDSDVTATDFDEGDSLLASLTATGRASIVAENSAGDQLTDATEMTGSATGLAQVFRSLGINVALVSVGTPSVSAPVAPATLTKGTYTITFDVTAFGGDMYVDGTKPLLTGVDSATLVITPATGGTGTQDAVIASSTGATMTGTINTTSRFLVSDGETERFTITSVVTPTVASGLYSVSLTSLPYGSADADITDALVATGTAAWEYTTGLADFVTSSANLTL